MADVTVTCPECHGQRFSPAVLAIEFNGKSINQLLDLTVREAMDFFQGQPKILKRLQPLIEIGLGYLQLGQSTATLSGGEAQRLKLASYLSVSGGTATEPFLFLFDEPTTGLHLTDIHTLILALRKLLESGHSVIVIEHNIELLSQADYLIDLGPEGGTGGGQIMAEGTPEQVADVADSFTGQFLKARLHAQSLEKELAH